MADKKTMRRYLLERLTRLDENNVEEFLQDLCTFSEIENMAQRLYAAKLMLEGKTYTQVEEETSISTATLSRVSACIKYGPGGYKSVVEKP